MRFLSRRRLHLSPRPSPRHAMSQAEHIPANHRSLYDRCVIAAKREQEQRLNELRVMRESLDLLGPFMLLLVDRRLVLCPEALRWNEAEGAIAVDLTRLVFDPAANSRLIDTLCDAGFEVTGRTEIGPWYSVRIEYGTLAICVQGLSVDTDFDANELEAECA